MTKLADDFGKERSLLAISSILIFFTVVLKMDFDFQLLFVSAKLVSKDNWLLCLLVLSFYFSFRTILEWLKSDGIARSEFSNKADFYSSLIFGVGAIIVAAKVVFGHLAVWDLPFFPSMAILIIGEVISATISVALESLAYIRTRSKAYAAGLPRIPIATRGALLIYIPLGFLLFLVAYFLTKFFGNDALRDVWLWIIATPILVHAVFLAKFFLFPDEVKREKLQLVFDQHDAAYQVYGYDRRAKASCTDLYQATEERSFDKVRELVEHGADPNRKEQHGWTPFMLSVANGDREIVDLFLRYGADVNVVNNLGRSALNFASRYGFLDLVEKLVFAGADINGSVGGYNGSPLMAAIENRHEDVAMFLIEIGADVGLVGPRDKTALRRAEENELGQIASMIRNNLNRG